MVADAVHFPLGMFEALVTDAAEGEHVVVSFVVMKKKGSSSSAVSLGRRRRASSADVRSATKTMVPLVVPSGGRQQQHYRGGSLPDLFASGYSLPTNISVSSASEKVAKKLRSASPPLSSSPPSPSTSLFSPLPQEMLRFPTLGAMLQLECGGAGLVGGGEREIARQQEEQGHCNRFSVEAMGELHVEPLDESTAKSRHPSSPLGSWAKHGIATRGGGGNGGNDGNDDDAPSLELLLRTQLPVYVSRDSLAVLSLRSVSMAWYDRVMAVAAPMFGTCFLCGEECLHCASCCELPSGRRIAEHLVCKTCEENRNDEALYTMDQHDSCLEVCEAGACGRVVCTHCMFLCSARNCGCRRLLCIPCSGRRGGIRSGFPSMFGWTEYGIDVGSQDDENSELDVADSDDGDGVVGEEEDGGKVEDGRDKLSDSLRMNSFEGGGAGDGDRGVGIEDLTGGVQQRTCTVIESLCKTNASLVMREVAIEDGLRGIEETLALLLTGQGRSFAPALGERDEITTVQSVGTDTSAKDGETTHDAAEEAAGGAAMDTEAGETALAVAVEAKACNTIDIQIVADDDTSAAAGEGPPRHSSRTPFSPTTSCLQTPLGDWQSDTGSDVSSMISGNDKAVKDAKGWYECAEELGGCGDCCKDCWQAERGPLHGFCATLDETGVMLRLCAICHEELEHRVRGDRREVVSVCCRNTFLILNMAVQRLTCLSVHQLTNVSVCMHSAVLTLSSLSRSRTRRRRKTLGTRRVHGRP